MEGEQGTETIKHVFDLGDGHVEPFYLPPLPSEDNLKYLILGNEKDAGMESSSMTVDEPTTPPEETVVPWKPIKDVLVVCMRDGS